MLLNLLILINWVVVFVTSIPTIPPNTPTSETLEEMDPHDDTETNVFLGTLKSKHSKNYGVSGNVSAINCTTISVENFSYDGRGIRVNWVAGKEDKINKGYSSSFIIPDETGSTERIRRAYSNEYFYLNLPENKTLFGVQWISLLCRSFNLNLGSVRLLNKTTCEIPDKKSCDVGNIRSTNDTHELGELLGDFKPTFFSLDYGIKGSFFTVIHDPQKIYIKNFSYNGNAPSVFFYVGLTDNTGKDSFYVPSDYHSYNPCNVTDGFIIGEKSKSEEQSMQFGQQSTLFKYDEQSLLLTLPSNYTIYNIRWVMVWCYLFALDMGRVSNNHFIAPTTDKISPTTSPEVTQKTTANVSEKTTTKVTKKTTANTITKETTPKTNESGQSTRKKRESSNSTEESSYSNETAMILLGKLDGKKYDVEGMVHAINSTTLFLSGFYYNAKAPDGYFYAGSSEKIGDGFKIPDETGSEEILNAYENQNLTLSLPDGKKLKDLKWFSVFCDSFLEDFGHIRFDGELLDIFDVNTSSVHHVPLVHYSDEGIASDNQTEMSENSENKKKSNMSENSENKEELKMSENSENKEESNMSQKVEPEQEPHSMPEPGDSDVVPRTGESTSKGIESLTTTSYQLSIITLGLCLLFR